MQSQRFIPSLSNAAMLARTSFFQSVRSANGDDAHGDRGDAPHGCVHDYDHARDHARDHGHSHEGHHHDHHGHHHH